MSIKILHAFSPAMFPRVRGPVMFSYNRISKEQVQTLLRDNDIHSCIGHQNMAKILSHDLGIDIDCDPQKISLNFGEQIVLGQYHGPPLDHNANVLPEGGYIIYSTIMVFPRPDLGIRSYDREFQDENNVADLEDKIAALHDR